jgi:hypothetical protein
MLLRYRPIRVWQGCVAAAAVAEVVAVEAAATPSVPPDMRCVMIVTSTLADGTKARTKALCTAESS